MPQSWVEGKQDRHAACYIISVSAFFSLVLQARAASRERTGTGPAPRLKDTLTGQMVGDGHICCCRAQTCDLVATVEGGVGSLKSGYKSTDVSHSHGVDVIHLFTRKLNLTLVPSPDRITNTFLTTEAA